MKKLRPKIPRFLGLMERRGWDRTQLARALRISPANVTRILKDERGVGPQVLRGLAELGEEPFSYVLESSSENEVCQPESEKGE